tara:strand:+ start:732 stop:992 length:261 start_codon:yes stop_codon:yes gene_type:complete
MNKKAQTLGLAIIVAVTIFIVGMLAINFLKPEITRARGSDQLNCADTDNISDGVKITCLVVDVVIPYFIILIFLVAGGIITARFLL